jgi:flagellar motor switch protein FliN/FliY
VRARIAGYACAALGNALNGLTGAGFEVTLVEGDEPGKADEPLIWRQPFSLAEGAILWLVAGKDLRDAAGQMVLGGTGTDAASDEDCRSTWNEIAAQTMGGMARAISSDLGREVLQQGGEEDAESPGDQTQKAVLEVRSSEQIWHVRIAWSDPFALEFSSAVPQTAAAPSATREPVVSKTLELLLDVALPVSVSFGKTLLQIREVLKLNTGSVVELDRLVSEPVEVIVNNCVIARGEVVVVDGNYGVRVIHLASREDRLRSGMTEASARLGMV